MGGFIWKCFNAPYEYTFYSILFLIILLFPIAVSAGAGGVVSLKPNITDIVYELGAGDKLVGVTRYCDIKDSAAKPKVVGDYTRPYIEEIIALQPDMVLASKENTSERAVMSIEAAGIKVKVFSFENIAEIETSIQSIADALGLHSKGDEVAKNFANEIGALNKKWGNRPGKNAIIIWGIRPVVVAGHGSYIDELLKMISIKNPLPVSDIKYPKIGIEELVSVNPDVIIDLAMGSEAKETRPWSNVKTIKAVKEGSVYTLNPSKFRAGPNLPKALNELAGIVYKNK